MVTYEITQPPNTEWFDDTRSERRWIDVLTLVARVADEECLGKTRDVSLGGLGAVLHGLHPTPGEAIAVDILFEGEVREFRGEVVHSAPCREGSRVGIRLGRSVLPLRRFLEARYGEGSGGLGSVT